MYDNNEMVQNTVNNKASGTILHVTESLGGGVLESILNLCTNQYLAGWEIEIHFVIRDDTPPIDNLKKLFPENMRFYTYGSSNLPNLLSMFLNLRKYIKQKNIAFIHLHSTKAGFFGKLILNKHKFRIFYSPHSFAFLRLDKRAITRRCFKILEKISDLYGNVTTLGVSVHECKLATDLKLKDVKLLFNFISDPIQNFDIKHKEFHERNIDVCNIARLVPQKNPKRFIETFKKLESKSEWAWVGADSKSRIIFPKEIELINWMSHEETVQILNSSRIFLSTSDWEGLSISLIEAQMMGVPAVVWDIPSNHEIVIHGKTGFICSSEDELSKKIQEILLQAELWKFLSFNARNNALKKFERVANQNYWKQVYFNEQNFE